MAMSDTTIVTPAPGTRAVLRRVEAGNMAQCATCGEQVKFAAKQNRRQVIANIYVGGRWDRVEHFHAECYDAAGLPWGSPADGITTNGRAPVRPG
jgi:hypothetical protein